MDLEAAHDKNSKANRLTLMGMAFCFLVTGGILLSGLAATSAPSTKIIDFSASR